MARPSDEDSGVRSLQELAPRYTSSQPHRAQEPATPFWSSQMPVAAPPYAQSPPTWSQGQWSMPLQPVDPPHYTPRPIGMGMRQPRRWGLRFMMFLGLVGLGAFLGRNHLPRFPRSMSEASTTWESLTASVRRVAGGLGGSGTTAREAATPPTPARGPQIVPLPSEKAASPPVVAQEAKPRPRPQVEAPEPAPRPRVVAPPPARPVRMAAVSRPPAPRKSNDPFESDAAAAAALSKPLALASKPQKAPVAAAPREAPAPVERAAPEPRAAPGSLDDLMNSSLKGRPAKANKEIDRRLAGVNETRDPEPRKKADAEPAAAHALTRNEIQTVMKGVQTKISSDCYQKYQQNGPADLKLVVNEDGSVATVSVSGQFAGTPTGACVEKVARAASFPESAGLRFDYRVSVR